MCAGAGGGGGGKYDYFTRMRADVSIDGCVDVCLRLHLRDLDATKDLDAHGVDQARCAQLRRLTYVHA